MKWVLYKKNIYVYPFSMQCWSVVTEYNIIYTEVFIIQDVREKITHTHGHRIIFRNEDSEQTILESSFIFTLAVALY